MKSAQRLDYYQLVERAREDWLAAKAYFENVSDPDLVDHAIHLVMATEKKYMYLIRQAREQGIQVDLGGIAAGKLTY